MLKPLGKKLVDRTARNPLIWPAYKACGVISTALGKVFGHAQLARNGQQQRSEREHKIRRYVAGMFPELVVTGGPFRGMRYPAAATSHGSELLPKLLGSYEAELHSTIEELANNSYNTIVNVGCGEGYYAVGTALKFPSARVYAFDIQPKAQQLCVAMAEINGVSPRLSVAGECDAQTLLSLPLGDRALIISDCEGYELQLFTRQIVNALSRHDLIIEAHDFINIEISSTLRALFSATHTVRSIHSTDDIQKAHTYRYSRLADCSTAEKRFILGEYRPAIMEWLVAIAHPGASQ